jgi:hypothetical protein
MRCAHLSVWSVELWASAAAMCCASSAPMEFPSRLYAHVYVRRPIQRTYVAHDARSNTHNRVHTHAYVHADIPNTNTRVCLARIPTFIPVHNAIVYTMHKHAHFYAFARAGYVLHSREYLECGVVGKCCSNALRSLLVYVVVPKPVRTCVCAKIDTVHVRSARCAIPYIQPSTRSCAQVCRLQEVPQFDVVLRLTKELH